MHLTCLFFSLQVTCWPKPEEMSPDKAFPSPLEETLSDFLLVSGPRQEPRSAETDWPVNALLCCPELSEPELQFIPMLHPREHQQPGERHLQAVEAHVHQGESGSALPVSCT